MKASSLILVGLGGFILWMLFGKRFSTAMSTAPVTPPANPVPQGSNVASVLHDAGGILSTVGGWFSTSNSSPPPPPSEAI